MFSSFMKYSGYRQALFIFDRIRSSIEALGGTPGDVVRTRTYVTDASYVDAASRAHGEIFHDIRPASTMLVVSGLVDPELLVEIEATAVLPDR
ncbi:hypothetical protein GF324_10030 [bacterium]|nr:hypothetical protein [bacterium]